MVVDFKHGKLDVLAQIVLEENSVARVQLLILVIGFQLFLRRRLSEAFSSTHWLYVLDA